MAPDLEGQDGIRRLPYFSTDTVAFFGPATGTVGRDGATMRIPVSRLALVGSERQAPTEHLRRDALAAQDRLHRDRLASDFVSSVFHGLPAIVTYDGRSMIAVGYHIHTMRLLPVDPDGSEAEPMQISYLDEKLAGPVAFVGRG